MAAQRGNGGSWAVGTAIVRAWLVATLIAAPAFSSRPARAADLDAPDAREEEVRRRIQADSAAAAERERQIVADERRVVSAGPLRAAKDLYQKQDFAGAAAELEAVIAADPDNPDALLLAGLAHLRLDDPANAGTRWERFTAVSPDPKLAQEIGRYNTIVLHEANLRYAKEAVARERELVAAPTSPRAVAVAPFRNAGSAEYAPLGKALASMLIDNLAPLPGVLVLEREQVNALIEEAKLVGTGLVEKRSAVRAGKLLRAGRVVAGSHEDWTASPTHLRIEVALVGVDAGSVLASTRTEAPAAEFYKLIPGVAEEFAGALGQPVERLPAEVRQQIRQTHTRSIQAELLYGQALDALDRKDVDAARDACEKLAAEDPGFSLAKRKCDRVPAAWLTLPAIVAAVEALILTAAAGAAAGAGIST
ncbi:MAG: tetratricopeptide repeat protein, partial [Candidatus Binatia bacterium]